MRKKFLVLLVAFIICLSFAACEKNEGNSGNASNVDQSADANNPGGSGTNSGDNQKPDHKIYKYMKVSADLASTLYHPASTLFNDPSEVSSGDIYYKPCLIAEFDTNTGKATKVTFYTFFLDSEDDTYVNEAMESYNSSSNDYKKNVTDVQKGRVNDNVSYLSAEINPESNAYEQHISSLFYEQDIERYKDKIFFSRLDNYSSEPPHEEGENFFEESLEGIRIEWSDTSIEAF